MSENDVLEIESELSKFFLAKTNQHATLDSDKSLDGSMDKKPLYTQLQFPQTLFDCHKGLGQKENFVFFFLITVEPLL